MTSDLHDLSGAFAATVEPRGPIDDPTTEPSISGALP
jgi:hypothetical protein